VALSDFVGDDAIQLPDLQRCLVTLVLDAYREPKRWLLRSFHFYFRIARPVKLVSTPRTGPMISKSIGSS
jgi:hypothetical protein